MLSINWEGLELGRLLVACRGISFSVSVEKNHIIISTPEVK